MLVIQGGWWHQTSKGRLAIVRCVLSLRPLNFLHCSMRYVKIGVAYFGLVAVLGPDPGGTGLPSFPVLLHPTFKFRGHPWIFAKLTQISHFLRFQIVPNCFQVDKFASSVERPKTKSASAAGHPLTPWPGDLLMDPAGGCAPDPRYRLALPRSPWGRAPRCCGLKPLLFWLHN